MPLARPSLQPIPAHSSSSRLQIHHAPLHSLYPLFANLTFHIVPAKIGESIDRLYESVEELGGKCVSIEAARFVVTALRGRPRLVRAIGREWIDTKPVLAVDYIQDTYQRCLDAAAEESDEPPHLPPRDNYIVRTGDPVRKRSATPDDGHETQHGKKRRKLDFDAVDGFAIHPDLPDMEAFPEEIRFQEIPPLCVDRASPLVCVNQDIINAIKPIYEDREFEEAHQKNSNVLSYRRSMSILKSVPRRLKSGQDARKLLNVGERVAERIDEFLQTGRIAESEAILASPRHRALTDFASVYTIGHHTAKDLYDQHNCRTLEDVRLHYQNIAEESEEVRLKEKMRRRREGGMTRVDIVEEWMMLKDELDSKIPREEVREIDRCVMEHLVTFLPGCESTITGGYRRGKPQSNDVDIVFCPPEEGQDVGLLRDLYRRLSALEIVTHVLHVTHREASTPITSTPNNFDNLDKAFVIFKLPGSGRKHRRVDLISAPRERYAAAVLSWSGSMMFERDLRRYAENIRGLKFRGGLVEVSTGKEINLETEREIFYYLGLRYVPPTFRNADG